MSQPAEPPSDDKIIYPSPGQPLQLMVGHRSAWFLDSPTPPGFSVFNSNWRTVLDAISIHSLILNFIFPYDVWVLKDFKPFQALINNASPKIGQILSKYDIKDARRILVCRAGSNPFGDYLLSMSLRQERFIALVIMFFGHRNAAPCSCCAKRYAATICEYRTPKDERRNANVHYPFLYCISHPLIANGKCGNCVYHVYSPCEYNTNFAQNAEYPCIKKRAATLDKSPMKPARRIHETTELREAVDWRELRDVNRTNQWTKFNG